MNLTSDPLGGIANGFYYDRIVEMRRCEHTVGVKSRLSAEPGIKLESGEQGRVSLLFPEHWFPVGNRTSQCRTRSWAPLESQWDHKDQLDQLSAEDRDGSES